MLKVVEVVALGEDGTVALGEAASGDVGEVVAVGERFSSTE